MKKHLYFFISSIITILLSIYSIINSNKIVNDLISSVNMLPSKLKDEIKNVYIDNGNIYITIISICCILISLLFIFLIIKKKVTRKRFIYLSILGIFTSPLDLISFLFILNLILCITIKNDISVDNKIPILEYKSEKKYIRNSLILILVYLSQYFIKYIPINNKIILAISLEILLLILSIILFYDIFKNEFILFKNNFKSYIKYIMPKFGGAYIIYIIVSLISVMITNQTTSVNQESLEKLSMWYLIPSAIIWAPIVEETIFRRCIRFFIKNDKVFIISSALIFGLLHTIGEENIVNIFVIGLPYIVLGGLFSYLYTKTNNIFSNMFSHMLMNTIAIILILFRI